MNHFWKPDLIKKYRKVAFRIRSNEHVKVIPVVIAVPGGIPSDVIIRLRKISVTCAVGNAFGSTVTDTMFTLSVRSYNGGTVTG